ncbi:MAG: SRPBCC family protein [Methylococcales bacterium]
MFQIPYQVTRSIRIDTPLAQVQQTLVNFKTWPQWSPWLCLDKQTQLEYFGADGTPGSGYRWSGQWIGQGQIQQQNISAANLDMRIEFFKPWRSVAKVGFKLKAISEDSTEVTWHMQGGLPFFLFFMKSGLQAYIGMDYQRGLLMLKDYLETGLVYSNSEVLGIVDMPEQHYLGVSRTCSIDDISTSMQSACADLQTGFAETGLTRIGAPFTVLHEWNLKTRQCSYTFAFPIAAPAQPVNSTLIQASRAATKALKIIHTGAYKHLGNGWATGYCRLQNDKTLKANKKQPSFEIYISDPAEAAAKDLLTEIYIPVL